MRSHGARADPGRHASWSPVTEAAPRSVAESQAVIVRLMEPTDANMMGNVFGGVILADVDRAAYISATRHARSDCVTASVDRLDFLEPVRIGEVVEYRSMLTCVGRSSMEVWVEAEAEGIRGGAKRHVVHAYLTMVAVGPEGRPVPVAPLAVTTEEERRRFEAGQRRMEMRQRTREHPPVGRPSPVIRKE
jgi:acyl-CoA hydrolase